MKVVRVADARANRARVSGKLYFRHFGERATGFLPAACPHRGGPLHLSGSFEEIKQTITCPWHELKHDVCRMQHQALPMVKSGETLHLVLPAAATVFTWREA